MRTAWIPALALLACGAPSRPAEDPALAARATEAWSRGDLDGARAIAATGSSPAAREIAARAALALGDPGAALEALDGAREEPLVRLRAAAMLARSDWAGAARTLAALPRADDDPLAVAVATVAAHAHDRALLEASGEDRATFDPEAALPVVAIALDGRATHALVATSIRTTVLAPAMRADHGVIDELAIGRARVRAVPFFTRPLEAESEALGVELGAVLGLDVLGALGATIDREGVALGAPPIGEPARACAFDGSFLAIDLGRGGAHAWWLLDTAGAFAAAWTPAAAIREGAVRDTIDLAIGETLITEVPLSVDVVGDEVASLTMAPIEGALGWGLLATMRIGIARDAQGASLVTIQPAP